MDGQRTPGMGDDGEGTMGALMKIKGGPWRKDFWRRRKNLQEVRIQLDVYLDTTTIRQDENVVEGCRVSLFHGIALCSRVGTSRSCVDAFFI